MAGSEGAASGMRASVRRMSACRILLRRPTAPPERSPDRVTNAPKPSLRAAMLNVDHPGTNGRPLTQVSDQHWRVKPGRLQSRARQARDLRRILNPMGTGRLRSRARQARDSIRGRNWMRSHIAFLLALFSAPRAGFWRYSHSIPSQDSAAPPSSFTISEAVSPPSGTFPEMSSWIDTTGRPQRLANSATDNSNDSSCVLSARPGGGAWFC